MKNQSSCQSLFEIKIKRNELLGVHSCIMIVLNNEIPAPQDAALLLEAMSDLANQDKDTKKEFTIKIKEKQLKPLWHCCNIVLQNELQKGHMHATDIIQIQTKLAEAIDAQTMMGVRPLELVK